MKINYKHVLSLATAGIVCGMALPSAAGPGVYITPPAPPTVVISPPTPPTVVVTAPAPPVTVAVVPDDYVWDGTEYVGVVNGQYYYLGPDNTWVVMDPVRLHRFQGYMHDHPDWNSHMTHNVKYRGAAHAPAHTQPMHDSHGNTPAHDDRSDHNQSDHNHNGPPQ